MINIDNEKKLIKLYDWIQLETKYGKTIVCGGMFPDYEIKKGQKWQGVAGHTVTIEKVNKDLVHYFWYENRNRITNERLSTLFQCRYNLILTSINMDSSPLNPKIKTKEKNSKDHIFPIVCDSLTLDEFVSNQIKSLKDFKLSWKKLNKENNEIYPLKMLNEEWSEQLMFWQEQKSI